MWENAVRYSPIFFNGKLKTENGKLKGESGKLKTAGQASCVASYFSGAIAQRLHGIVVSHFSAGVSLSSVPFRPSGHCRPFCALKTPNRLKNIKIF